MSTSSAEQAKSEAKLAKREAKLAKQEKKAESRKKKLANAPLRFDFHEAFFYTKKTPKGDKKGHKTGEVKQKTSKGATLIDPKAAALLTTGTLQWFEYQTRNIAEQRTSKFDKNTLKNINTLNRFFHSNVEIDELKSQFAQVTVVITSERVAFFKRAHKAWKQLKLKCQDISADLGKRDSDLPLVGFKDAMRKTSGPLGRHIKIINKFFQQYASYVKYRAKWKEDVLGKPEKLPVSVEIREQMSFQTEDDYQSSGEDSESAEESAHGEAESENSDEESANEDASSGESAEESAAEQSPKAAAKKKSPKKSDYSSGESAEESAEEPLRRTPKPKTKRGYDEIASDNKRASNKKKKKRRKKNKKSKGSPSAATP